MSQTRAVTAFVIRRRGEWIYNDQWNVHHGGESVAAYLDRGRAEARRRELEIALPFDLQQYEFAGMSWASISTMPLAEGVARLRAVGLEPPADDDWEGWFYEHARTFTPDQQTAFRDVADRFGAYEVVEMQVEVDEGGP